MPDDLTRSDMQSIDRAAGEGLLTPEEEAAIKARLLHYATSETDDGKPLYGPRVSCRAIQTLTSLERVQLARETLRLRLPQTADPTDLRTAIEAIKDALSDRTTRDQAANEQAAVSSPRGEAPPAVHRAPDGDP